MPRCLGPPSSVRASTPHQRANCPQETHVFWPLTTKWSSCSTARVRSDARSEPASGSEKPWHQISSADEDRRDVAEALLVAAEAQQRRAEDVQADDVDELRRAGRRQLLVDDDLLGRRLPGDPRRQNRIKQIDSSMDRFQEVRRRTETHEIPRPWIVGEQRHDDIQSLVTLGRCLVPGQPADADAIEWQAGDEAGGRGPQLRIEAALDDPEHRLVGTAMHRQRSLGPAMRPLGRVHDDRARRTREDRLVERERDVRPECLLDLDGDFGREPVGRTVEVTAKGNPVVVDDPQVAEGDDLETARIR